MAKKNKTYRGLALHFIPHNEIRKWDSDERIKRILSSVLGNQIVMIQGKLNSSEEARLIGDTMAMIGHVPNFKGIELAVINGKDKDTPVHQKVSAGIAKMLVGDISSMTIIGPATIVKEIKRNPKKIELMLN
jgi:hypothetical protein